MSAALSLTPCAPDGEVRARVGFAGSELHVQGQVASVACAYAPQGTTIEIAAAPAEAQQQGYALLAAHDFVMKGTQRGFSAHWDAASPTSLRLALKLGFAHHACSIKGARLSMELPAPAAPS